MTEQLTDATEAALEAEEEAGAEATLHHADSIRRNTFFGLATQVTTAAFTAVLTLFLVRKLGPHDYGLFALSVGIGTLLILVSDLGITGSAGRFIAEESGNVRGIAAVVSDSTWMKLFVLVPVCAALWLLAEPIANAYGAPGLIWPLRGMSIAVLGQGMFIFYRHAFVSIGRVSLTWRMRPARLPRGPGRIAGALSRRDRRCARSGAMAIDPVQRGLTRPAGQRFD
jgi:Polysaccharide biosynthesis protein